MQSNRPSARNEKSKLEILRSIKLYELEKARIMHAVHDIERKAERKLHLSKAHAEEKLQSMLGGRSHTEAIAHYDSLIAHHKKKLDAHERANERARRQSARNATAVQLAFVVLAVMLIGAAAYFGGVTGGVVGVGDENVTVETLENITLENGTLENLSVTQNNTNETVTPAATNLTDTMNISEVVSEQARPVTTDRSARAGGGQMRHFKADEPVEIEFNYTGERHIAALPLNAVVYDSQNEETDITPVVSRANGKITLHIDQPRAFRPGKYRAVISTGSGTVEQNFTWGVLAVNTHKSIYHEHEEAFIAMAVLDDEGHMVCDADVVLEVTAPSGETTVLSTSDSSITVSPDCGVYDVTEQPDYYTTYTTVAEGNYELHLVADTQNGQREIRDTFRVDNNVPFDVIRRGPTRIYPFVPQKMNITITPKEDYTGVISEYVPLGFTITPQDGLRVVKAGDVQMLQWQATIQAGENRTLFYEFDAPDESPEFYILGELAMNEWKEARQWQIVGDAGNILDDSFTITPTSIDVGVQTSAVGQYDNTGNANCDQVLKTTENGVTITSVSATAVKLADITYSAGAPCDSHDISTGEVTCTAWTKLQDNVQITWVYEGQTGGGGSKTYTTASVSGCTATLDATDTLSVTVASDSTPPTVNLSSPANETWINNATRKINFTYVATDASAIANCTLWTNYTGTFAQNTTNQSAITSGVPNTIHQNFTADFREMLWNIKCDDIFANSAMNQTNTVGTGSNRTVRLDATKPTYVNPSFNTTLPLTYDWVNYTINWTDNVANLSQCGVMINNGTPIYFNYTPKDCVNLYMNISFVERINATDNTNVSWIFWANDSAGNMNFSAVQSFIVRNESPTYRGLNTNITEQPQTYEWINFSVNWTDNSWFGLNTDKLQYCGFMLNNGTPGFDGTSQFRNYTPKLCTSPQNMSWVEQVNATDNTNVSWLFWANDTTGNMNFSIVQSFFVRNESPKYEEEPESTTEFRNSSAPVNGEWINYSINWTDNSYFGFNVDKLQQCWFGINETTETLINTTPVDCTSLQNISFRDQVDAVGGSRVYYQFYANDTTNIVNSTPLFSFVVASGDSDGPSVNLSYPDNSTWINSNSSRRINFTYVATDASAIANCTLWTNYTGTFAQNTTNQSAITSGVPNTIHQNFTADFREMLWNIKCDDILANSAMNQTNTVGTGSNRTIRLDANTTVAIYNVTNASAPFTNTWVNFSINWSDNFNLSVCGFMLANDTVHYSNVSYKYCGFAGANDNKANVNISFIALMNATAGQVVKYMFWANDTANNINFTSEMTLHIANSGPIINYTAIVNITAGEDTPISIAAGTFQQVNFTFHVFDADGTGDIDNSTARLAINITSRAEDGDLYFINESRVNSTCHANGTINANTLQYLCSVYIWYWDASGDWTINATVQDISGNRTENSSTQFRLAQTTAMVMSPTVLTWATFELNTTNKTASGPLVINNTGNKNIGIGGFTVTGYDLELDTTRLSATYPESVIRAQNFSIRHMNASTLASCTGMDQNCYECNGTQLLNATGGETPNPQTLPYANMSIGNNSLLLRNGTSGQEELYVCLRTVPPQMQRGTYDTAGNWTTTWTVTVS